MHYQWFEEDIEEAWKVHLFTTYSKVTKDVFKYTGKSLQYPTFKVNANLNYRWGEWSKSTRTITFSTKLLKNFEWAAVEHVMRHEVAHQIVDEIFNIPHNGHPHGDAWKRACLIVNIPPDRTNDTTDLSSFKGSAETNPMIDKIRKLLVKGNDCAVTKEESQLFLNKAQELMIKHNVSIQNLQGIVSSTFYTIRPVGPLVDGYKTWLGQLASLVCKFYNVNCIWLSTTKNDKKRIEFFGTPDNLDIAEYVFHALITQAEYLYEAFKNEHQEKLQETRPLDYRSLFANCTPEQLQEANFYLNAALSEAKAKYNIRRNTHRISKRAFMQGLVHGYYSKLSQEKKIIFDSISSTDKALIANSDKILRDAFEKKYNSRSLGKSPSTKGHGYDEGRQAGLNLTLAQGVTSSSNSSTQSLNGTPKPFALNA